MKFEIKDNNGKFVEIPEVETVRYSDAIIQKDNLWRSLLNQYPWLNFPSDWDVCIIPPFSYADARFRVRRGGAHISVYLDLEAYLGAVYDENGPIPYWEIYPYGEGVYRVLMSESEKLIPKIEEALTMLEKEDKQ